MKKILLAVAVIAGLGTADMLVAQAYAAQPAQTDVSATTTVKKAHKNNVKAPAKAKAPHKAKAKAPAAATETSN